MSRVVPVVREEDPVRHPEAPPESLHVEPWSDAVIDALGHDPRSWYVEEFWLGVLGPSATWLMRRFATRLEKEPEGFTFGLAEEARRLGLGHRGGRRSPFLRALGRCVTFELAQPRGEGRLAVRRRIPPLNRRQLVRLAEPLASAHRRWQQSQLSAPVRSPAPYPAWTGWKAVSSSSSVRTPKPVPPLR